MLALGYSALKTCFRPGIAFPGSHLSPADSRWLSGADCLWHLQVCFPWVRQIAARCGLEVGRGVVQRGGMSFATESPSDSPTLNWLGRLRWIAPEGSSRE